MNNKLSISDLSDLLASSAKISKKEASNFLKILFELIEENLITDKIVKINGLGTFKLLWVESRRIANVNTGNIQEIPGHYKTTFSPDADLSSAVNEPYSHLETISLDDEIIKDKPIVDSQPIPETPELEVTAFVEDEMDDSDEDIQELAIEEEEMQSIEAEENITELIQTIDSEAEPKTTIQDEKEKIEAVKEKISYINIIESPKPVESVAVDLPNETIKEQERLPIEEYAQFLINSVKRNRQDEIIEEEMQIVEKMDGFATKGIFSTIKPIENDKLENNKESSEEVKLHEIENDFIENSTRSHVEFDEPTRSENPTDIFDQTNSSIPFYKRVLQEMESKNETSNIFDEIPVYNSVKTDHQDSTQTIENIESPIETGNEDIEPKLKKKRGIKVFFLLIFLAALATLSYFGYDYYKKVKQAESIRKETIRILSEPSVDDVIVQATKDTMTPHVETKRKANPTNKPSTKPEVKPNVKSKVVAQQATTSSTKAKIIATEPMEPGSRLTSIAEKYYGSKIFWVYLFKYNQSKIKNPNKVPTGIIIEIPEKSYYSIDNNDKESFKRANSLSAEILRQFE